MWTTTLPVITVKTLLSVCKSYTVVKSIGNTKFCFVEEIYNSLKIKLPKYEI